MQVADELARAEASRRRTTHPFAVALEEGGRSPEEGLKYMRELEEHFANDDDAYQRFLDLTDTSSNDSTEERASSIRAADEILVDSYRLRQRLRYFIPLPISYQIELALPDDPDADYEDDAAFTSEDDEAIKEWYERLVRDFWVAVARRARADLARTDLNEHVVQQILCTAGNAQDISPSMKKLFGSSFGSDRVPNDAIDAMQKVELREIASSMKTSLWAKVRDEVEKVTGKLWRSEQLRTRYNELMTK